MSHKESPIFLPNFTLKKQLLFIFLVKLVLLLLLPLTEDEAYFLSWGREVAAGYYDHPPLMGWVLFVLQKINHHIFFLRLMPLIIGFFVGWLIYHFYHIQDNYINNKNDKAKFWMLLWLYSPAHLLLVPFTNDSLLLLFCSLSSYFFYVSLFKNNFFYIVLCGIFLGLGFLSKYFVVILALGFLLVLLYHKRYIFIVALVVSALPFGLQHLWFNYENGWVNLAFNLGSRQAESLHFFDQIQNIILLLFFLVYLTGFLLIFQVKKIFINKNFGLFLIGFIFIFFISICFKHRIGLHWILFFLPLFYIQNFDINKSMLNKQKILFRIQSFVLVSLLLIAQILSAHIVNLFHNQKVRNQILFYSNFHMNDYCGAWSKEDFYVVSYGFGSILNHYCHGNPNGTPIRVLFSSSKYGRNDDAHFNPQTLDQQNIKLLSLKPWNIAVYQPYFSEVNTHQMQFSNGVVFYWLYGKKFNYPAYHKAWQTQYCLWYQPPAFLPTPKGQFCPVCACSKMP